MRVATLGDRRNKIVPYVPLPFRISNGRGKNAPLTYVQSINIPDIADSSCAIEITYRTNRV